MGNAVSRRPPVTTPGLAQFLDHHRITIALHPAGAECLDEIDGAVTQARYLIDLPPDRVFLGRCSEDPCTEELFALKGDKKVTCRSCGANYSVDELQEWLLRRVQFISLPIDQLAGFLSLRGFSVTQKDISRWAKQGRLRATGQDSSKRRKYQIGDVLAVASEVVAGHKVAG